jgi:hypothetical protein
VKHRTEHVYDTEMAPLIAQLIKIADREGIPLLVSAGMLDPQGGRMTADTLLLGRVREDVAQSDIAGTANRYRLCIELIRGHEGLDRAAGLVISRFHPDPPPAARQGSQ